jgi:hypothetical protein
LYEGYGAHNDFYVLALRAKGVAISYKRWSTLQAGDKVIVHQKEVMDDVEKRYDYEILTKVGGVTTCVIRAEKEHD